MAVIHSSKLLQAFVDAGILPKQCRRMIIDAKYDDAIKLYYEVFADDRILALDLPILIKDEPLQVVKVGDIPDIVIITNPDGSGREADCPAIVEE